jgi:DNA polymerase-1
MSSICFDIEGDGLKPTKIHCVVSQDVDTNTVKRFDPSNIEEGFEFLKGATKLIGHNIIGYDIPAVRDVAGVDLSDIKLVDTLVLSRLFNPQREGGHSLESWGYRLNFAKGDFGQQGPEVWDTYSPEMLDYCAQDVSLNTRVYRSLVAEARGFSGQCIRLEHEVYKIINQQIRTGFLLDEELAMRLSAEISQKLGELEERVREEFKPMVEITVIEAKYLKTGETSKMGFIPETGKSTRLTDLELGEIVSTGGPICRRTYTDFNLGSRQQIGKYLISYGWKPSKFTPTGQPIVDEGTLKRVKGIPQATLIAEYLMLQKRLAQVNSWIKEVKEDGRVHGYVNPNGAVTGRMTHSHPNMAQVPSCSAPYGKEFRSCWTVPKGYKLVGIDASQLELRMLAHHMNDEGYINEILNGDIHTANQKFAGLESRNQAKTFIYALLYGAGDAKIGSVVSRGREAGTELKRRFFDSLPPFKKFKDRVSREAAKGFVKGLDGRKIYVRSAHSSLNTKLQGDGAIALKEALVIFDGWIKEKGLDARIVANVHDEWQVEAHESIAEEIGKLGVAAIVAAGESLKLNCPLDGDYNVGDNWSETH